MFNFGLYAIHQWEPTSNNATIDFQNFESARAHRDTRNGFWRVEQFTPIFFKD